MVAISFLAADHGNASAQFALGVMYSNAKHEGHRLADQVWTVLSLT